MKNSSLLAILVWSASGLLASFGMADDTLVAFKGAIGVIPVRGNVAPFAVNTVLGVTPGGQPWVINDLDATVKTNGEVSVNGSGLLLAGSNGIGTTGGQSVAAQLFCGSANFTSPGVALDPNGDFRINDILTPSPLPATCDTPVLLIRSINLNTGVLGNWFAAGILKSSKQKD